MAKKSVGGPNKSEAIRGYKRDNSSAGPKEIAEALTKDGIKVTSAFVSTVLSNDKRKTGKPTGRRGRGPGRRPAVESTSSINQLIQAKKLVDTVGSVAKAREALEALAKLLA